MGSFFVSLFWLAISLAIGGVLGEKLKGQQRAGTLLGLLGPIGWICVILLTDKRAKCPACKSALNPGATKCARCGTEIPRAAAPIDPAYRSARPVEDRESWKKAVWMLFIIAAAIATMVAIAVRAS